MIVFAIGWIVRLLSLSVITGAAGCGLTIYQSPDRLRLPSERAAEPKRPAWASVEAPFKSPPLGPFRARRVLVGLSSDFSQATGAAAAAKTDPAARPFGRVSFRSSTIMLDRIAADRIAADRSGADRAERVGGWSVSRAASNAALLRQTWPEPGSGGIETTVHWFASVDAVGPPRIYAIDEEAQTATLVSADETDADVVSTHRRRLTIEEPSLGADRAPRGLLVVCSGLDDGANDERLRDEALARGYVVLHAYSPVERSSLGDLVGDARGLAAETVEALLSEYTATTADRYVSASATAVADGCELVFERWAGLREGPIAVVGLSAGSQTAPAVALRIEERRGRPVDAFVAFAGGADFLSVADDSVLRGFLVDWVDTTGTPIDSAVVGRVKAAFRERAALDPFSLAPSLRGVPSLCVQASGDRFISKPFADLLWERLGRPERWTFRGGHVTLFWRLQLGAIDDRLLDWIEGAVRRRAPAEASRRSVPLNRPDEPA
ncbi:MAG: hypothetical protein AAF108_04635 [Planctomycetota bacterium]